MTDKEKLEAIAWHMREARKKAYSDIAYYKSRWQQSREAGDEKAADSWWTLAMEAYKKHRIYCDITETITNIIY